MFTLIFLISSTFGLALLIYLTAGIIVYLHALYKVAPAAGRGHTASAVTDPDI